MKSFIDYHQIKGILACDNWRKKQIGRWIAYTLGFEPGGKGPDGGVDGLMEYKGNVIYFQSKLESDPLDVKEAERLHSALIRKGANVGIIIAGVGYKTTFWQRFNEHPDHGSFRIYALTLLDYLTETEAFARAKQVLPPLRTIDRSLEELLGD
jgi:hypothetical protein